MKLTKFRKNLLAVPLIGIARGVKYEQITEVIGALIDSGLLLFEVTLNTENAFEIISKAVHLSKNKMQIGAGTVLSAEKAEKAIQAGAEFIVSPVHKKEISTICHENNCAYLPGAMTPTETLKAWEEGGTIIKVFPTSVMGLKYIKELRGPFKEIPLLACGGVNSENITDYLSIGANAIAFGSSILNDNSYDNPQQITEDIRKLIGSVK